MFHRLAAAALVAGFLLIPRPAQATNTCENRAFPVTVAGVAQTMAGTPCIPFRRAMNQAGTARQVVQAMHPRFDKIVLGGHSLGSAISVIEATTYHDVDGVLVTTMGHHVNALGIPPNAPDLHAAVVAWADRMVGR